MTIYTLSLYHGLTQFYPGIDHRTLIVCVRCHTQNELSSTNTQVFSHFFFFNGDDMCLKLSCLKREILFYNHSKLVLVTVYSKSLILLPLLPTNNLQVLKQKLMFVPFGNNSLFGKTVSQIPYFEQVPNSGIKSREHQTFHTISFRINLLKK